MSGWLQLDERIRQIALESLTDKQLTAYKLSANGVREDVIAIYCGVSRRAIRDRLAEADVKIRSHPDYPKEAA